MPSWLELPTLRLQRITFELRDGNACVLDDEDDHGHVDAQPPHLGEFILGVYLEPHGISGRDLAERLGVAPSMLNRVLRDASRVTPEMALRLSRAVGRSAESWLAMQDAHNLWVAHRQVNLDT